MSPLFNWLLNGYKHWDKRKDRHGVNALEKEKRKKGTQLQPFKKQLQTSNIHSPLSHVEYRSKINRI